MTTQTTRGMDMQAAAQELGVKGGRNGLYKLLREMGHFCGKKPRMQLINSGFFFIETKRFKRGPVEHQYSVPIVTGTGLAWLQEQIETHEKTETLRSGNPRPTEPGATTTSAGTGT